MERKRFPQATRKRQFTCVVCGRPIRGWKPVGDDVVFDYWGDKIAKVVWHHGRMGYCHTECLDNVVHWE